MDEILMREGRLGVNLVNSASRIANLPVESSFYR